MEAEKYSEEVLRALSNKLAVDIYGEDDECLEDTADDIYRTLKETKSWDDGAFLASQYCHNSGAEMCNAIVDNLNCAQMYAHLFAEHGIDFFERMAYKRKRRKMI